METAERRGGRVVATVGVFDGVHRGHQRLIARVLSAAARTGTRPVALTFDPPPEVVLRRVDEPFQITPAAAKLALLEAHGLEEVHCLAFTPDFARLTPAQFVQRTLLGLFDPAGLVVGYDFRFGAGGSGNAELLRSFGRERGFWVEEVEAVLEGGEPVSSTRVRDLLRRGAVGEAAALLGRPFSLAGSVGRGRGVGGRELVPTANLEVDPAQLLPADGVYVATVLLEGRDFGAAAVVGAPPTLGPGPAARPVEVHLLDFQEDLYGRTLEVRFLERLRDQRIFSSLKELREAIEADLVRVRGRLAALGQKRLAGPGAVC